MSIDSMRLLPLGWSAFFSTQIPLEQFDAVCAARVIRVDRGSYRVATGEAELTVSLAGRLTYGGGMVPTVGDWVLLAPEQPVIVGCLERRTVLARREADGTAAQAIAANVDRVIVVGGLDGEFNLHRIERYLVMAAQAGVTPLVLLTKADCVADPGPAMARVGRRLTAPGEVLAVNALRDPLMERLAPWLGRGVTAVVVGSSGVGKSTVINNLAGGPVQATAATRRDAKGRHTTTARSLIRLADGSCIIDVPGMREVGLADEGGVGRQFAPLAELARGCRFADCTHQSEPGCAVREAVARGEVEQDAWEHYLKLLAEERHQVADHERRRRERVFGKVVRQALSLKERERRR